MLKNQLEQDTEPEGETGFVQKEFHAGARLIKHDFWAIDVDLKRCKGRILAAILTQTPGRI